MLSFIVSSAKLIRIIHYCRKNQGAARGAIGEVTESVVSVLGTALRKMMGARGLQM